MAGLASLFGVDSNPFLDYTRSNRGLLMGLSSALASGDLTNLAQTMPAGLQIDQKAAEQAKADAKTSQQENYTLGIFEKEAPDLAAAYRGGAPMGTLWSEYLQRRSPKPASLMNVGDGQIYNPNDKSWITNPNAPGSTAAPSLTSIYDSNGREQKGYMQGTEFVPVGSPKATTERPEFTVSQATAAGYADRMTQADAVLSKPEFATVQTDLREQRGNIPVIGNLIASPEFQQADQAQRDFINAILRRESGAVISDSEFANARRQYFPQPGDSEAVLRQKAANRKNAINGVARAAGPAYQAPDTADYLTGDPAQQDGVPQPGAVEDGYRFLGGDPSDPNSWEPL